ncbi:polysaccharide deacetylase family protein [Comamonadaceae bacterium OTU4NAUVB1]|nr:polysaccharide deacetylase family protein [Comamonadaceae bacterium OTU4NAUVB1]
MLAPRNIVDVDLPEKTLCLTYDDGPGPDSAAIGRFLHAHGVRATFFVVGKFAVERPEVLDALHAQGHIIGNHTFEHPDMPYYVSVNGDVRDQVIRTNTVIRKYTQDRPVYFRATYGKWSPEVADELNVDPRSSYRHVGPVYWDIAGIDCYYWKLGKSVEEAAEVYLKDIEQKGKGIIVMHDAIADMDTVAAKNRTLELTQTLIPRLQALGYRFVGLDEIDDPQLTSPAADTFGLKGHNGRFLQYAEGDDAGLRWAGRSIGDDRVRFSMEDRGQGKIVLRTPEGRFLSVNPDVDETVRLSDGRDDPHALFDSIPVNASQIILRSHNGNYLASEAGKAGALKANAPFMRQAWALTYVPATRAYLKPPTLSDRLRNLRKAALFVKSKVLHA